MHQVHAQLAADHAQRPGHVGSAPIDVVGPGAPALAQRLLKAVLVRRGRFAQGEVAVGQVAGRRIDLGEQVGLADLPARGDDRRPVHRVADPQVAGVLDEERAALGGGPAGRPRGEALRGQQAVDARARERTPAHEAGALEHTDQAADAAPRALALGAHEEVRDLGGNGAAGAPIAPGLSGQRREPALAVGVEPGLQRARRARHEPAVGSLVHPLGHLLQPGQPITVLEPRAHQRPQHAQLPERQVEVVVVHGGHPTNGRRPLSVGCPIGIEPTPPTAPVIAAYMRRTPGARRWRAAASTAHGAPGAARSPPVRMVTWRTRSRRRAARPTAVATLAQRPSVALLRTATGSRADEARRAVQRRRVRAGTGEAGPRSWARPTRAQLPQRQRARNAGRIC